MDKQGELQLIRQVYERTRKCVVTGPAAAVLLGIATLDWVTVVDLQRRSGTAAGPQKLAGKGAVFHSGKVRDEHILTTDGIDHVNGIRMLFDTFAHYGRLAALVSIESARNKWPKLTVDELLSRSEELPRANGMKKFRELIESSVATSQSALETIGRDALIRAALPEVVSIEEQVGIRYLDENGEWHVAYPDLLINNFLAVEFDGKIKHSGLYGEPIEVIIAERNREKGLQNRGFQALRVGWSDVLSGRFLRMVAQALRARELGPQR